ncbi:MAG: hypothetical protein R3F43_00580 [bacterium]
MVFIGGAFADLDLEARADMVALSFNIQLAAIADPDGTWMAQDEGGVLGSFMGVQTNEDYLGLVPAAYHDPLPPWTTEQPYPKVFRKTFADLWCQETPLADLARLASRCIADGGAEAAEADLPAACRLCEELADARFRDGCSADDPDLDPAQDGICRALVDDPEAVEWLYLPLADGEQPADRIRGYCRGSARRGPLRPRAGGGSGRGPPHPGGAGSERVAGHPHRRAPSAWPSPWWARPSPSSPTRAPARSRSSTWAMASRWTGTPIPPPPTRGPRRA